VAGGGRGGPQLGGPRWVRAAFVGHDEQLGGPVAWLLAVCVVASNVTRSAAARLTSLVRARCCQPLARYCKWDLYPAP
jgi:hypothetical protein